MKRAFLLLIMFSAALLSACGGTLSIAFDATPTPAPLSRQPAAPASPEQIVTLEERPSAPVVNLGAGSDSETIRRAMLASHLTWQTIWVDGMMIDQLPGGEVQRQRVQLWIDRPTARFRVLGGPWEGEPETVQVSDGLSQARITLSDATTQTQPVASAARDAGWSAPVDVTDTITPHPLDQEIDSRLSELIFPAALAERGGGYSAEGMEVVAGRAALHAAWSLDNQMHEWLWIDAQTGVLLRVDSYGKDPTSGGPVSTVIVNEIAYDIPVADALFALTLAERPRFALDSTGAVAAVLDPPSTGYAEGAGSLYFVVDRSPDALQLARLPGSCITGTDPCPAPETVDGFPNLNGNIQPLVWSPGADMAALAVDGTLWVYDPGTGKWNPTAMFPILVCDPLWSPDGQWIMLTVQDDRGQDIYAVRPDGSELTNLTGGKMTGYEQLWPEGWMDDGRLLFSAILGRTSRLYTIRAGEDAQPLGELEFSGGIAAVDPGGTLVVTGEQRDGSAVISLMVAHGGAVVEPPRRLASFGGASVAEIAFAPGEDAQTGNPWIVMLVSSGSPEAMVTTLYAVRADGTDMRQIFQTGAVQRFTITGDGRSVVVEGTDNGRLTVVTFDGQSRVIEAPDLRLDRRLAGASWRQ